LICLAAVPVKIATVPFQRMNPRHIFYSTLAAGSFGDTYLPPDELAAG